MSQTQNVDTCAFFHISFNVWKLILFSDERCGQERIMAQLNMEDSHSFPAFPEGCATTLMCQYSLQALNGTRIRFWFDSLGVTTFGSAFYIWVSKHYIAINFQTRNVFYFNLTALVFRR